MAVYAYESITVANSGIGVTTATADYATSALLTLESAQIRFRLDGTAPTTTEGHLLEVGDTLLLESKDEIQRFLAIRTGATSGTLKVTFFV